MRRQHVPEEAIPRYSTNARARSLPHGVCSFRIDYGDHYHYFDPSVSRFNFLRYSDRRWRWFNPSFHFQDRLRHADYLRMFKQAGFEVVNDEPWRVAPERVEELGQLDLAPPWRSRPLDDLAVGGTRITLRCANDPQRLRSR